MHDTTNQPTNQHIILDGDQVDEAKLQSLISAMALATGADIDMHKCFLIASDRPECLGALKSMFGGNLVIIAREAQPELIGESDVKRKPQRGRRPKQLQQPVIKPDSHGVIPFEKEEVKGTGERPTPELKTITSTRPVMSTSPVRLNPLRQHREIRSWHVWVNDKEVDVITISEKNRRLNCGEFETGTIISHPKAGKNRITGEMGEPQGMEPI